MSDMHLMVVVVVVVMMTMTMMTAAPDPIHHPLHQSCKRHQRVRRRLRPRQPRLSPHPAGALARARAAAGFCDDSCSSVLPALAHMTLARVCA